MKNKTESIERYLRQEMSAEELKQFTFQMVMDKNLRKEVDQMRMIFKTIRSEAPIAQASSGKWLYGLLLLAVVLIGGLYFFSQNDTSSTPTPIEIQEPSTPVAYAPNAYFEELREGIRSIFTINKPLPNATYYSDNDGRIAFELNTSLSGRDIPNALTFEIWNNQESDFENDNFQLRESLKVAENGAITLKTDLELAPGLYYYVFSLLQTEEVIKVGKFSVYPKSPN